MKTFFRPSHNQLKAWLKNHVIKGGVDSITWTWPTGNAPVAPVGTNTVRGLVTMDGSGTTITITHNLGFSAAELTSGLPEVVLEPTHNAGHTSDVFISSKTANTVVLTYLAVAFSLNFTIRRPLGMIE